MSTLATRTVAPIVQATSKTLGVDLPKPIVEALAAADKLALSRRDDPFVSAGAGLTKAVADALLAGRDPLASKDVQRAALGQTLTEANIANRLGGYAEALTVDAIVEHADLVIRTWQPAVEKASAALAAFRRLAPDVDLNDPGIVGRLRSEALTPWGQVKEAAALLVKIAQGWTAIASVTGLQIPDAGGRPLIVASLSLEQINQLPPRPKVDAVMQLDVPLELADTKTYTERTARLAQEQQAQEQYAAAAPEREREARRKTFGVVMIP